MNKAAARAKGAEQPPSTGGTSAGRARLWSVAAGVLAVGMIAAVAQVASADPIVEPATVTARAARIAEAQPAKAVAQARKAVAQAPKTTAFADLGDVTLVGAATAATAADALDITPPPPPPTTTTTTTT
ncbi:MAG: hypothetical protein JWO77_2654, partial [Ilumatobacteraceae bacterium]|nr:hypothetical protein [Ilumatobacteraceae bacterium]